MTDRLRRHLDVVALVVLAYLPTVTAAIGRGVADTKLYLFLDPARLIADARYTWDPQQFAGWVPHQTALYIWPSGPWFWLGETIGVPDWLTHRLWIGTILLLAGLGVRSVSRLFGLTTLAAFVAAVVYQTSPYVLPYISRTSVMLLPFAGLGWIVAGTVRAAITNHWRHAAVVALVVLTVGATNATATLMIAPAPVLWLLWSAIRHDIAWRRALVTAARIGALSLAVSLWWIVKLAMQGRYGAPVLSYSETLEAVSATSTAPEIARGLGYWLFYVRDPYIATTTAAAPHLNSTLVIAANFAIVIVGLVGLVLTRWATRGYAALLLAAGLLLGVGAHTLSDPSVIQRLVFDDSRSGLALALRSSSRAVPLVTFALALGAGALVAAVRVDRLRSGRPRLAPVLAGVVVALALVGLPALRNGGYVDPALERDDDVPAAWTAAAARLDADPDGARVLQMPGQESAAFRWGYTVDPPLPGLSHRPLVARDWLPAGSAGAMDLLDAFDDREQAGVLEPASIAPVARWLGADTIWLAGDIAYDRFDTARPEPVARALGTADDVGAGESFGDPVVNAPSVPMLDEDALGDPAVGTPLAPVSLHPVSGVERWRASSAPVVVAGSGDGLIDAAAAGVLDGRRMVRYLAAIPPDDRVAALAAAPLVVVTDSNRVRAHHWRGSQDVVGFTEDGIRPGVLVADPSDQRLAVFPDQTADDTTIAVQRGAVTAAASRYGEALRYRPENRAAMAIDGDTSTAWIVGDRGDPNGEFIDLTSDTEVDSIRVVQPLDPHTNRWITRIAVVLDPDTTVNGTTGNDTAGNDVVTLDERSRTAEGQRIDLARPTDHLRLVIESTDTVERPELSGVDGVGFAEIDLGVGATEEVVVVPRVEVPDDGDVAVVLSRLRVSASDRWRSDPERTIIREIPASVGPLDVGPVTVRLDRRADDSEIAQLLGGSLPVATSRLLGYPTAGGWAAVDGDDTTAWTTAFARAVGASLRVPDPVPSSELSIDQPMDGRHSVITQIEIARGSQSVRRTLRPDDTGRARVALPRRLMDADGEVFLTITAIEPVTTVDRRTFDTVQLPTAISEVTGLGTTTLPVRFDTGCRTDLLSVDSDPVGLRISGRTDDAFAGEPLTVEPCGVTPTSTGFDLRSHLAPGLVVDRVVLRSPGRAGAATTTAADPVVTRSSSDRTHRTFSVTGCTDGCWLNAGEGRNDGWRADVDGTTLDGPVMVDGGMGGWWIPPGEPQRTVTLTWEGQSAVDIALVISGLSVAGLAALVLVTRSRRRAVAVASAPVLTDPRRRVDRRHALAVGAIGVVVCALAISWSVALVVAVGVGIMLVGLRSAPLLAGFGTAMAATIAATIVLRQRSGQYMPDFGWITHFDDLHRPFLVAAAFVVIAVVTESLTESQTESLIEDDR